jgi:hypothetical protein
MIYFFFLLKQTIIIRTSFPFEIVQSIRYFSLKKISYGESVDMYNVNCLALISVSSQWNGLASSLK